MSSVIAPLLSASKIGSASEARRSRPEMERSRVWPVSFFIRCSAALTLADLLRSLWKEW